MLERERLKEWYEESRALLEEARAREIITEEDYYEKKARLAEEYQRRLAAIQELTRASSLQNVLGGAEEVLQAMGSFNQKALRMARAAGAAQAFIATVQGAAEELKKGVFGFKTAAMVMARGMAFVGAIRNVSDSGSTPSPPAASGGGSGAAAMQAIDFNFTITNDPFGIGENVARQMSRQINQAQRDGMILNSRVST